ncbi:MAG TPA: PASTA domain-containing protein [Syntrophales bacterium]|nr:PASTA domain-containing protein [Syntrophales bacterium]
MNTRTCFVAMIALLFCVALSAPPARAQQGAPPLKEKLVKTPDVTRMPLEKARETAKKAGFDLTVNYRETAQRDADNVVLEQQPVAIQGSKSFSVHVGKYKAPPVPHVSKMPLEQAKEVLQKAGYEARVVEVPVTDEKPLGVVLSQELKAQPGTNRINVFVGVPEKMTVPHVLGMTGDQAMKTLEKAGLKGTQISAPTKIQSRADKVAKQEPLSGAKVAKNSTVTLTVQTYQAPQVVPNLAGMSESDARTALTPLGCPVEKIKKATPIKDKDQKVIAQYPAANTTYNEKGKVVITVAEYSASAYEVQITPNPADKSYRVDIWGGTPPLSVSLDGKDAARTVEGKKVVEMTSLPQSPGVNSFRLVSHADVEVQLTVRDSKGHGLAKIVNLKKDPR